MDHIEPVSFGVLKPQLLILDALEPVEAPGELHAPPEGWECSWRRGDARDEIGDTRCRVLCVRLQVTGDCR